MAAKHPDITKNVLLRASKAAIVSASRNAMAVAGFIVAVENGWLVRKDNLGAITKLKQITKVKVSDVVLD